MITRLLVPLDGSTRAEAALPVAAQMTRALQGTLILVRVPDVPFSDLALSVTEAEVERAHTYLTQMAHRPELAGLHLETRTRCGAIARTILDTIQAEQADLLVMSSHGRSGFTRLALGSIAEQVIRHASVPVLVLHKPPEDEARRTTSPIALVALDGSSRAESALLPAAEVLAARCAIHDGILRLVRVVPPPVELRSSATQPTLPLEQADRVFQEAGNYMLHLAERLRTDGIGGHCPAVIWSLWVAEEIGPTLAHAGERVGPDKQDALFLALASHGRGHWKAGSIAMRILEHSTLPLLIVPVPPE